MAGGLRIGDIRDLPEVYQDQIVEQIIAKVRGKLPLPVADQEENHEKESRGSADNEDTEDEEAPT